MFKNIIFDFGQVIVRFDPEYMTGVYMNGNDAKLVSDVVFDRLYWDKLDDGSITDQAVIKAIKSRLPENLGDVAECIYKNWYHNLPLIDGIEQLINQLKKDGIKLYLLSNISNGFAENYMSNMDIKRILSAFDGLVFSAPLGIVKPNREIFEHLLKKFDLNPCETLFVDDSEKNINGAKALDINTYLFDGSTSKLKDYIYSL
jgi:putative hydrolase of the HAD superfamily